MLDIKTLRFVLWIVERQYYQSRSVDLYDAATAIRAAIAKSNA